MPNPGRVLALGAVLIAAVLAGACGGRRPTAETAPGPEAVTRGGVLRMVQEAPVSLDPLQGDSVYEAIPVNQLFDGLVAIDAGLNPVPALASSWRVVDDGKLYRFTLRDGVRFHDGTRLVAEDVVFTFRRVLRPGAERRNIVFSYLAVIEGAMAYARGERADLPGVEAVDDRTVRIRLDRPYPSFLQVLAMDGVRIVPRGRVQEQGEAAFSREPVGTGPFRLRSWGEDGLRLDSNPDYFLGPPYLDGVELMFYRADDDDGGASRFYAGELDVLEVPSAELSRLSQEPGVRIHRHQELSLSFLGLLTTSPPLDDPRIRRAIAHAIDRDALLRESPATRRAAVGILPPGLWGYSPSSKALPYDRGRARQLLLQAGTPGGAGLPPVELLIPANSTAAGRLSERLVNDLGAVGIRLELRRVEWPELSRRTQEHRAQAFLLAWIADLTDPDSFLRTLFYSGAAGNYFDYRDAETDELLERGARELNPVVRARLYREVERRILEHAPMVPLYHTLGMQAMRDNVRGLEPGPLGMANVNLEQVWLAPAGGES